MKHQHKNNNKMGQRKPHYNNKSFNSNTSSSYSLKDNNKVKVAAKIGAYLFILWGILHIWVGFEGSHQYIASGASGQWDMLLGGKNAPHSEFQHSNDPLTQNVHSKLLLNFCLDVGGYGVLGLVIGWMILRNYSSWVAYFIGLFVIGIGDLAFLFTQVTSGIIEASIPTISGPALWFLAVIITPIGLIKNKVIKNKSGKN